MDLKNNMLWNPLSELQTQKSALNYLSSLTKFKHPVSHASASHLKLDDDWHCLPGYSVPVKRINNEVSCLSKDGKTCAWGFCNKKKIIPVNANSTALTCKDYKVNWCNEVNKILPLDFNSNSNSKKSNFKGKIRGYNSFIDGGLGLCQTVNNTQPSWEQKTIHEDECAKICLKEKDCMGYSYSIDGRCQLYNTKTSKKHGSLHSVNYGDTLSKGNTNPSWKCKIKIPKVAVKHGPVVQSYKFTNPQIEVLNV